MQHWLPATFRERGVAVPFTTPALAGARIRMLERRPDVVVPHPGGARGVYVLALASLAEFCVPNLHDVRLAGRLAALTSFSPGAVRAAAAGVAAEGAAGRAAAAAASAAEALDSRRQAGFFGALLAAMEPEAGSDRRNSQLAVHQLARRTGRTPEAVMADLSLLAAELARSALDGPPAAQGAAVPGRGRNLLAAIAALAAGVQSWLKATGEIPAAPQILEAAGAMHEAGRLVLQAGNTRLADLPNLLGRWAESQAEILATVRRPDWLLDGWEHVCLLWRACASDEDRAATLAEISLLLPPVPAEADAWLAGEPALLARLHARPLPAYASAPAVRDSSRAIALTARNERIRSLAA